MRTKTFWKGEVGVDGHVKDRENTYHVRLEIKGSYVNSYSCSCSQGNSYKEMCPHEKAVLEYYQQQAAVNSDAPVSTSSQVRAMIREYTNGEVADILQEKQESAVRFIPRIRISRQDIRAEFRLGRERTYIIKDLPAFARAVEQGLYVEYGKNLAFYHSPEAFSPESRGLLELVLEMVNTYEEHYEEFRKSLYSSLPALRELPISRSNRDRFFQLLEGKTVDVSGPGAEDRKIQVIRENPEGEADVRKTGARGMTVSLDRALLTFSGEKYLYILKQHRLFICDEAFTRDTSVFFRQMTQGCAAPYEVTVNEKDVPLFYERVLKKLEKHGLLHVRDLDLEQVRPVELKAGFHLESPAPGKVILRPVLSYGDYSFHPAQDEKVPRTICRDVPAEFRISQILTRYFKYRDAETNDLVIEDDEEALFSFLSDGISELKAVGEVYFPEEGSLEIVEPPIVAVGVQVAGGWLELTIDAGDLSNEDLMKILEAYRQKKRYYRLKSGEFLRLEDNGLLAVAQMADGLSLSKKELRQKRIRIPRYRALYLDSLCRERKDICFTRDQMYKSIVRGMKLIDDSDFEAPEDMAGILRGYQKTGFRWLKTLDAWGFSGILADDMGLGKTIQIISVLYDESRKRAQRDSGEEADREKEAEGAVLSLIICPASLIYNWEYEIQRFAPSLKVLVAAGTFQEREELLKHAGEYDAVITSYDLLRRDLELYMNYTFRFQVIDEAQYIKNPGTRNAKAVKAVRAVTRYALTGTPVENRLSELWSIFDYLMPGFLYSYQKFKKEYEIPVVREGDQEALKRLKQLTGPFILRRLKGDVLKELPGKLETVVYSRMEKEQRELYTAVAWQLRNQLNGSNKIQILAALTRLRQVCCDPRLVYENYYGGSAKLETCMELLMSGTGAGHKILLFSQFASMLKLIGRRLEQEGLSFYTLTGETPKEERIRMVNSFHKDDTSIFLISLKAGGTGLNLTAADMVIHYDPWWNAAAQNQATDRAHRIGQDKQVAVFQLITRDTIEENILKLQKAKEALASQIVTEGTVSLANLSREELLELLG